jgi:serine/threonine protein kinase
MADGVNETIGRYHILAQIRMGGATTVYKAHDPVFKRDVMLKVLESEAGDRLEQQFLALSRLKHPNLQSIYEVGRDGDRYFIVREWIEGQTLADAIKARQAAGDTFTLPEIADILTGVGSAIDYVREQISAVDTIDPTQVVIDPNGKAIVTGLELASVEASGDITPDGVQFGNPAYMSPEQVSGKPVEARSDVYSLGTMLYELTTGSPPFEGTTSEIVMKHIAESVPRPSQIKPDTPEHIEQVILKALNKDPAGRHQTVGELARELAQALAVESSTSSGSLPGAPVSPPASDISDRPTISPPAPPVVPPPSPGPPESKPPESEQVNNVVADDSVPEPRDEQPSPPLEPPETVSYLRLDAAVPNQVSLSRTFEVGVAVRQPASPILADEDLPEVDSGQVQVAWPQAEDRIRLRVRVSAPECEIRGDDSYSFRLYRGQDSSVFYFHLVPQQQGELSIVVTVYQQEDWLGSTRVETVARAQAAGEVEITVTSRPLSPDLVDEDGSLRRQLARHHANLLKLQEDRAIFGAGQVPLHLFNQIQAEEQAIAELEAKLAALEPSGAR